MHGAHLVLLGVLLRGFSAYPASGVGGGVLFVPLVSGFFPFHLDFVRGAGLLVALAGALAAGPGLLRRNFANLRLALPVALIASACAIVGAMLGLALPTNVVQTCLGATILGIAVLLLMSKNSVRPVVTKQDAVGLALGMNGVFLEPSTGEVVEWKPHPGGFAALYCHRHHGRHVRSGSRLGQRASA